MRRRAYRFSSTGQISVTLDLTEKAVALIWDAIDSVIVSCCSREIHPGISVQFQLRIPNSTEDEGVRIVQLLAFSALKSNSLHMFEDIKDNKSRQDTFNRINNMVSNG